MYYLIAFYQRIVELWCQAMNFPNDPRIVHYKNKYLCVIKLKTSLEIEQGRHSYASPFTPVQTNYHCAHMFIIY